jgi:hypothetical protein
VLLDPASNVTLNDGQSVPVVVSLFIPAGVLSGTLDTTVVTATSLAEPNVTAQAINTTQVAIPRREIFLPLVVKNP